MFKQTRICTAIMLVAGGGASFVWLPAFGQQSLERVEITGSSIKRIDAETALPVQVITREQIRKTGATNVEQLMQTITSISSSGGMTASTASGATTGGLSAISLHGLTSLRTLVLINGRRIAPYGVGFTGDSVSVDVNSIPLAAIERIEVLKDGASAIYGSDAIAGVVNFILRQEFSGAELTAEYGDTTQGGADFKRASILLGHGSLATDRYNVMLMGSYQKEGELRGAQRRFARVGINDLNDTSSGNTFPANIAAADGAAFKGSLNPTAASGCVAPYSVYDPLLSANACRFDPAPLVDLLPASERISVFGTAKYAITPDVQAYVEASYNHNSIRTIIQPVPISDQLAIPPTNPLFNKPPYSDFNNTAAIVLTKASPYYPGSYLAGRGIAGQPDLLVRYRAEGAGNRDLTDISEAPRIVAGVKGTAVGWDFDVNALWSQSKVREQDNDGYPLYSQILPILNSGNVNFFGPSAPDVSAALRATNFSGDAFKVTSTIESVAGRASREVYHLPGGAAAISVGAEGRKEKYSFKASPALTQGDIAGYGGNFGDTDRTRNVGAVFAELNLPIVKTVEANVAVRYDHYENVGNSTTPKASLRWQPMPEVLLRTSIGRGFRAPSLQDLYLSDTTGVSLQGVSDPLRCSKTGSSNDCSTQFTVITGGNQSLQPEKSVNFTLGAVFEPVKSVTIGIDYFRVRLTNTIVNGVDTATILGNVPKYGYLINRAAPTAADIAAGIPGAITSITETNLNLGTSKVSGIDFDASWRIVAGDAGRFVVRGTATYFNRFDTENVDGTFSGGVDQVNAATGGVVPRFKSYLSVDWSRGPWSVNVAQNFQKGYNDLPGTLEDNTDPAFVPRRVRSYTTYDLQTTYAAGATWRLTLGARNVFNTDPPYSNAGGQTGFQSGYDPQYGDPRGRFIYGRVTYLYQ